MTIYVVFKYYSLSFDWMNEFVLEIGSFGFLVKILNLSLLYHFI